MRLCYDLINTDIDRLSASPRVLRDRARHAISGMANAISGPISTFSEGSYIVLMLIFLDSRL